MNYTRAHAWETDHIRVHDGTEPDAKERPRFPSHHTLCTSTLTPSRPIDRQHTCTSAASSHTQPPVHSTPAHPHGLQRPILLPRTTLGSFAPSSRCFFSSPLNPRFRTPLPPRVHACKPSQDRRAPACPHPCNTHNRPLARHGSSSSLWILERGRYIHRRENVCAGSWAHARACPALLLGNAYPADGL